MNDDIFDLFASGGGGGGFFSHIFGSGEGGRRRPRRGENSIKPLIVSLEDLYKGKTSKFQFTKKCICSACDGRGGKPGALQSCDSCRGTGKVVITRQFGSAVIQGMAARCEACDGEGKFFNDKDKCWSCHGKKTVHEQKIIEVKVAPGMRENQKIVFYGEGDQEPDNEPGDVVLVLQTKPHDLFKRKNDDLFIQKKITVNEALCGYTTLIKHLDGRNIVLSSLPGEVIQPDSVRAVIGEGMPIPNSTEKGNLYIVFEIEFPKNHFTTEDELKRIEKCLPAKPVVKIPTGDFVEEATLNDYDARRYEKGSGFGTNRGEAYQDDDDSDGEFTGQTTSQVQCAQQ